MGSRKDSGYQFIHRPEDGNYSTTHIWSNKIQDTLCPTPQYVFKKDFIKTPTPPEYGNICPVCQRIISGRATQHQKPKKQKGPKMAPERPGEKEYLKRWKGVTKQHPSFWEKMDRDPVYEATLKTRDEGESGSTMSNSWGVGRPKGPR